MKYSTVAFLASIAATSEAFQVGSPSHSTDSRALTELNMGRLSYPLSRRFGSASRIFKDFDEAFGTEMNDIFDSPFLMRPATPFLNSINRRANDLARAPIRPSYNYKVSKEEERVQLSMELPGVKASDLSVQLEQGGRVLRLSGMREVTQGSMSFKSRFDKAFVLDRNANIENITANLSDGVLTITIPKSATPEKIEHKIKIHEGNPPSSTVENENMFQLSLDVPGIKANDMNIVLEQGGSVIRFTGVRKVTRNGSTFEYPFGRSFKVDGGLDADNITAYLENGVITARAPKREKTVQNIAINDVSMEELNANETEGSSHPPVEERSKYSKGTEELDNGEGKTEDKSTWATRDFPY